MQCLMAAKTDCEFCDPEAGEQGLDPVAAGTWKGTSYSTDGRGKQMDPAEDISGY